jgi:hypothetical protein
MKVAAARRRRTRPRHARRVRCPRHIRRATRAVQRWPGSAAVGRAPSGRAAPLIASRAAGWRAGAVDRAAPHGPAIIVMLVGATAGRRGTAGQRHGRRLFRQETAAGERLDRLARPRRRRDDRYRVIRVRDPVAGGARAGARRGSREGARPSARPRAGCRVGPPKYAGEQRVERHNLGPVPARRSVQLLRTSSTVPPTRPRRNCIVARHVAARGAVEPGRCHVLRRARAQRRNATARRGARADARAPECAPHRSRRRTGTARSTRSCHTR